MKISGFDRYVEQNDLRSIGAPKIRALPRVACSSSLAHVLVFCRNSKSETTQSH